ncbi:MAG: hypothetical protein QOJ43_101 [Gaiellaceae bacterium]|nr:hypothetical protein [Gaiellaceae bacterium]
MTPARTVLAAALCVAALVPAAAAGADGDPQGAPPVETTPPATQPAPPPETAPPSDVVTLDVEPPQTITLDVPGVPERAPAVKPAKRLSRVAPEPRRKRVRTSRRYEPVAESSFREPERQPASPARAKVRPHKHKAAKSPRKAAAQTQLAAPQPRDSELTGGVLAAEYSLRPGSGSGTGSFVYVLLTVGALAGLLLVLAGSAPALATAWPRAFVPVIKERERLFVVGLCVACGAFAWAITWVLAGSGA